MSRAGYSDDCDDNWALIRWRGAVQSAIRGKRGQEFLKELLSSLDAMDEKRLISNSFGEAGSYCTLGVACASRGIQAPEIDEDDIYYGGDKTRTEAARVLNIAEAMAGEIMFLNDEGSYWNETPESRWQRMRDWVASQIHGEQP